MIIALFVVMAVFLGAILLYVTTQENKTLTQDPTLEQGISEAEDVIFPSGGETFSAGQTITLHWNPDPTITDPIAIFLIDASLEDEGASVSISDRVFDIPNTGSYDYTIPSTIPAGQYSFQIGNANSNYFQIQSYKEQPAGEAITVSGEVICLPHKNPGDFVTMECAFGLAGEDGKNYGLINADAMQPLMIDTGKQVEVSGTLVSDEQGVYDVVGNIRIDSITELE